MGTCIGCQAVLETPRCDACGAAASPGGYLAESILSRNAHGRVYAARSPEGHRVALKELVFALAPDSATIDAFEREARLLASLDHPGIPRFVGAFHEGKGVHLRLYLAQELIDGAPLQPRLDLAQTREVARQTLAILAYLHAGQVLHRDVKPANLLRRIDGSIVLVDFGVARELVREATHGATLVGTFGYMPIEQLGGTVDARSDLYAVGATLLHLLGGKPPAERLRPDFSLDCASAGELRGFVERLCALKREDRFPSAEAALAALEDGLPAARATFWQRIRGWLTRSPRRQSWRRRALPWITFPFEPDRPRPTLEL